VIFFLPDSPKNKIFLRSLCFNFLKIEKYTNGCTNFYREMFKNNANGCVGISNDCVNKIRWEAALVCSIIKKMLSSLV
jgi:hypothetical protein